MRTPYMPLERLGLGWGDLGLACVPNLVDVLLKKQGIAGLEYLDYHVALCPGRRSWWLCRYERYGALPSFNQRQLGATSALSCGIKYEVPTGSTPTRVLIICDSPEPEKMLATIRQAEQERTRSDALHSLAIEAEAYVLPDEIVPVIC